MKKYIKVPFSQAKTDKESEFIEVIQYLADIINHIECQGYIDDMTEMFDDMEIEYSFTDEIDLI